MRGVKILPHPPPSLPPSPCPTSSHPLSPIPPEEKVSTINCPKRPAIQRRWRCRWLSDVCQIDWCMFTGNEHCEMNILQCRALGLACMTLTSNILWSRRVVCTWPSWKTWRQACSTCSQHDLISMARSALKSTSYDRRND